jgi:hypothetical protein
LTIRSQADITLALLHVLWSIILDLKGFCSPTSFHVPLGSATLGLIFTFRALETSSISLPGTQEYEISCPEDSRRTQSAVWVKLFAATVTTICIQGHSASLASADSLSWQWEIYRVLKIPLSPLVVVVSFLETAWYGFIDLLALSPGTWKRNVTLRYRVARFCHCCLGTDANARLPLQYVNPEHVTHSSLRRDMKWFGRMFILIVLSGQYVQAGLLLARRILSNTAATIDYAMSFLVLSGLIGLFRSLMISLAHTAWRLDPEFLPCVEKQCRLPGCRTFKEEQGFPNASKLVIYGYNVISIPQIALDWLAAGYAHLVIVVHDRRGFREHVLGLLGVLAFWHITLRSLALWNETSRSIGDDRTPEEASIPASTAVRESLPAPVTLESQETDNPRTYSSLIWMAIFRSTCCLIMCTRPALVLLSTIFQLWYIFGPCIVTHAMIASETTGWKNINATTPCPQLWKDPLEDELWWF